MIPTDTLDKLAECFDALDSLGAELTEQQWKTPTQLPGWTVQDNLSHIIGTERVLAGLPDTEHRAADLSVARNPIGEMNEHQVDARRSLTGAEVFAEFRDVARMRMEQLRTADEAYFARESFTPTGPGTVADFLHIRVLDCWTHEQDMRRALGMPGHRGGPAAEHTIDRLIRTVPIVVGKRAATPEGRWVRIAVTGGVERTIDCLVTEGRAAVVESAPGEPMATMSMDSDVFLQLATGRAGIDELGAAVTVTGDAAHAHRVLVAFNMMI